MIEGALIKDSYLKFGLLTVLILMIILGVVSFIALFIGVLKVLFYESIDSGIESLMFFFLTLFTVGIFFSLLCFLYYRIFTRRLLW